jgi:glutamate racemase
MAMRRRIGVIDSGMGGLTVVRSLISMRAPCDIVYVGDNANMPYGNRPFSEIVSLAGRMLDMLSEHEVEVVAIACNTISATVEHLRPLSKVPLVDIISPAAEALARRGEPDVGLFATEFTVKSGLHAKRVGELNPVVKVHGVSSPRLAALIDGAIGDEKAIRDEIASMLEKLASLHPVTTVLLGCTHYPIVMEIFKSLAPDIAFIDPADLQADEVMRLLRQGGHSETFDTEALNMAHAEVSGAARAAAPSLEIITSGIPDSYRRIMQRLGIPEAQSIRRLEA